MILAALLAAALPAAPSCIAIDGDRIRVRDLAAADARFEAADPAQVAGLSPSPNSSRVFWPGELQRLARKNQIASTEPYYPICVKRRSRVLLADEVTKAIAEWSPAGATIAVISLSNAPVPEGELQIPRPSAIQTASDGTVLLRGFVRFGASQRFPMWTRVRFRSKQSVIVANENLAGGQEIGANQVRIEERDGGIELTQLASKSEQVAGRALTRRILAGSPIPLDALETPKEVNRGSIVKVMVRDGGAVLQLDGLAETGGRLGDIVSVRNPSSGKAFTARVTGENSVLVAPSPAHGGRRTPAK